GYGAGASPAGGNGGTHLPRRDRRDHSRSGRAELVSRRRLALPDGGRMDADRPAGAVHRALWRGRRRPGIADCHDDAGARRDPAGVPAGAALRTVREVAGHGVRDVADLLRTWAAPRRRPVRDCLARARGRDRLGGAGARRAAQHPRADRAARPNPAPVLEPAVPGNECRALQRGADGEHHRSGSDGAAAQSGRGRPVHGFDRCPGERRPAPRPAPLDREWAGM
ncbi:MAG: FIG00817785: hypothetical protein, partial [uncultured Thermomicrobiales bacterium]